MIDSVKEQLSSCLDGELPQRELALLSKRIGKDRELCAAATRYALISETLRTGKAVAISPDFADRLMARIEAEPAFNGAVPRRMPSAAMRFLRPAAGLAVAASVAALALFSVQRAGILPSQPNIASSIADTGADAAAVASGAEQPADRYVVPMTATTTSAFIPATRLTNYVVAHSEYSSPLGRQRVVSGMLAEGEPEIIAVTREETAPAATEDAQR
jgi:sigma-E factor negative regulatory protein RseA